MSVIQQNRKVKKWTVGTVLLCFLLIQVMTGIFLYARPAQAQWVVNDPITGAQTTIKNIKDFLKILVVNAGTMALINAATRFTQKIAYDLAVNIASAGKGQTPLFSTKGWGEELKSAALDSAGQFIGDFGSMVGVDFCAPPNPRVALSIQLNLTNGMGTLPPPTCTWSQISSNWDSFISEVQTEDFLRQAASQFRIGYGAATDLDLAISANIGAFSVQESAQDTTILSRLEGQGFKAVTDLIGGQVKTPAQAVKQSSEIATQTPVNAEQLKWSISGQALSAGATAVLGTVASTFIGTLLSKTLDRIFTKGMYSLSDLISNGGGAAGTSAENTPNLGRRTAELAFSDLLTPIINGGSTAYDPLIDFTVCPDKNKSLYNCVMDDSFATAVRSTSTGTPMTVKGAIDKGYLHGDWFLIPPTNALNFDQTCFEQAYCYSDLVKLRKAMILPIGWELAAEESTGSWKLSDVVNGFNNCNSSGAADVEHPYCHLIDPNWILKIPPTICKATVYGPLLQTSEAGLRQETCVDMPTCVAEDEHGNCQGGWGYCTREKNIWRFDADQCPAYYDTCQTLTTRDGQSVSYITNTVDYGPPCNADDVGCRWYSNTQAKNATTGEWQWQDVTTSSSTGRSDRIFFNKNIAQCSEPGCNEFLQTTPNTSLNLIQNGSFEDFTGNADDGSNDSFTSWPTPWASYSDPNPQAVSGGTYFGRTALQAKGVIGQRVDLGTSRAGRTFTLSLYAKGCSEASTFDFGGDITNRTLTLAPPGASLSQWSRFSVTRTFTDSATTIDVAFYNASVPGDTCLIDAVQLEESGSASIYHEGWGSTGGALYLKTAPDYYSCYDYNSDGSLNKTNDADQCKDYAKACEEKDVGCEQYTPTNGDPAVPGVANYPEDYCPSECVGYQTFKQVATDFEQDKFPVYFIPSTGKTCSASDAGCDQFTSLETEALANFSSVRRCQKPGAGTDSAAFYTWEGSDTTGLQLKTWILKKAGSGAAISSDDDTGAGVLAPPCTALASDGSCDSASTVGLCTKADTLTNPDCREFYDGAGKKHYRLYSKTIVVTDDCHPYRKTNSNEADCGTSSGQWDATKTECIYNVYLPESASCSAAAVGCRAYRGNAGANTAIILNDTFDDAAAGATTPPDGWSAGSASSESLVAGGKSLSLPTRTTTSKDVSTSIRQGGIYTLSFWAKGDSRLDIKFTDATTGKEFSSGTVSPTNLSFDWRYFSLGPVYVDWDTSGGEYLEISANGGTTAAHIDNINLREIQSYIYMVKNSWTTPTSCDSSFTVNDSITDAAACTTAGGSWNADRSECILATTLPQAQLGCQSYTDRANQLHYLKSFSRLCSPDVAGCAKLIKTWNNSSTAAQTYNTANDSDPSLSNQEKYSDNVKVPADNLTYVVVDDQYKCSAQNKGCAEFGSPTLDTNGDVKLDDSGKKIYSTVDLLADPALYDSSTGRILCQSQFQGCEEYTTSQGGKLYFKDPGPRLCEWKEGVSVGGELSTGWFKKGTNDPCDQNFFSDQLYGIWHNADINCTLNTVCTSDAGCTCDSTTGTTRTSGVSCVVEKNQRTCQYSGWVGECAPQYSMCTKFIDPSDTTKDPLGQTYYYIKNDKIKPGNCNGMASQEDGCILVNDTSDPQLTFNAKATYISSNNKAGDQGGLVAPSNCQKTDCKRCSPTPVCSGGPCFVPLCLPTDTYCKNPPYCTSDRDCNTGYTCTSYTAGSDKIKNDSNLLIQVRRDRVCSEWLACLSASSTFNSNTGKFVTLCDKVGVCDRFLKVGDEETCGEWVDPLPSAEILTKDIYTSRDTTFNGQEYSGYSIPNEYPAEYLQQVDLAGTGKPADNRLAYILSTCYDASGAVRPCDLTREAAGTCDGDNFTACGSGKCWNHLCALDFKASDSGTPVAMSPTTGEALSCRGYPESESPFPEQLATWVKKAYIPADPSVEESFVYVLNGKSTGYLQANICEKGQYDASVPGQENCDCSYRKVQYGQGAMTRYYAPKPVTIGTAEVSKVYDSICQGGKFNGMPCDTSVDATSVVDADTPGKGCGAGGNAGTCIAMTRDDHVLGWQGYCLEHDQSTAINNDPRQTACLTWLPIDLIAGTPDIYNQYETAGFPLGNNYFCARTNVYENMSTYPLGALKPDGTRTVALECAELPYGAGSGAELECNGDTWVDSDEIVTCVSNASKCDKDKDWIIMAPCGNDGHCHEAGVDNCPYKCVPKNSIHTTTTGTLTKGSPCLPADLGLDNVHHLDVSISGRQVTIVKNYDNATQLDDCVEKGVLAGTYSRQGNLYLACANLTKVSESTTVSKAWTDRVWSGKACTTNDDCLAPENPDSGNYICLSGQCSYQISAVSPATVPYLQYTNKTVGGIDTLFGQSLSPRGQGEEPVNVLFCKASGSSSFTLPQTPTADGGDWTCNPATAAQGGESRPYMDFQVTASGESCTTDTDCQKSNTCPHYGDIYFDPDTGKPVNAAQAEFISDVCCFKRCTRDSDCPSGASGSCGAVASGSTLRYCVAPDTSSCVGRVSRHTGVGGTGDSISCSSGSDRLEVCAHSVGLCYPYGSGGNGACVQNFTCNTDLGLCQDPANPETILGGAGSELNLSLAKQRMAQLFASSYGTQNWIPPITEQGTYGSLNTGKSPLAANDTTGWDITETGLGDATPTPPVLYAVGPRCVGTECEELHADTLGHAYPMTVNDRTHGDIISTDGKLKVSLKFFFSADTNQMPVTSIVVDMNGDSIPEFNHSDSKYKNHRGLKPDLSESYCDNSTFGQSAGACANQYFSMEYTYTCTDSLSPGWAPGGVGCPPGAVGCCIFTPRVQVKDNWGWCNGTCPSTADHPRPNGGCYAGGAYADECNVTDPTFNHWTPFSGRVIVVPKQ